MDDFVTAISSDFPAYLRDLESVVNLDCGTDYKPGVDAVVRYLRERMRALGAEVVDFPQPVYGDCIYGRWRGRGSARILLIGHTDTVYPVGTAAQFPFQRDGSRGLGAGVNDMKSGLLDGIYALHAIVRSGFDNFAEIGIFCNSDEEVGSPVSRDLYAPLARGADAALVLEPGRENGAIVSSRKGSGGYVITTHGKSAHAGVEPDKGANAILALARHVQSLQALNGFRPGLTLNVGVIRGGTRPNVVPDFAQAEIDWRAVRAQDAKDLDEAVRELLAREVVPGVTAEFEPSPYNPPMEKTPASTRLVNYAKQAARELGFEIEDVTTGGASDGNHTAALGTPTLDGLGPVGGKAHNASEESMNLDSVVPRTAMLAKLIVAIANGRA